MEELYEQNHLTIYGKITLAVATLCLISFIILGILTGLRIVEWWTLMIPTGITFYWLVLTFGLSLVYVTNEDR